MPEQKSVTVWLQRLKEGESLAAHTLWQQYVERLLNLARKRLGAIPRGAADEEDVALSAFHALLDGVKDDRFAKLDDRHDLWQVLVMLTERKAIAQRRRETAARRGGAQVRGESAFVPVAVPDDHPRAWADMDDSASPDELADYLAIELQQLLQQLADPILQRIALEKLQGYTNAEMASRLGTSLRSVERKLNYIRRQWKGKL